MIKLKRLISYFSLGEMILWLISTLLIVIPFCIFDQNNYLTLFASIFGVTAIMFIAKGNPIGQFLMIFFGIFYGTISFKNRYYGETMTYVGMTVPMAICSLISWLKNPFNGNKSQVKIASITKKDYYIMIVLSIIVTTIFYFILDFFNTANMIVSTISITTSFIAVFLSFKRSRFFSLGYLANDIVLIVLWEMACISDIQYISVVSCFCAFMLNDLYTFINWGRIKKKQKMHSIKSEDLEID